MNRLPKTRKELQKLLVEAHDRGYQLRRQHEGDTEKDSQRKRQSARLAALQEMTKFLSVAGQTILALSEGMKSEADQL